MNGMIEIKIKPSRELFFNEESFFGIYACEVNPDDHDKVSMNNYGNISIKGITPKLNLKQEYVAIVKEDKDSKYKGSYTLESIKSQKPQTVAEQKTFLQSILTEAQVENIYKVYKEDEDVVGLIERGEFEYQSVKGLGDKTFEKLQKKVMDNLDISEVLAFCKKFDIKYNMVARLVKEYKNPTIVIQKIEENPYILTEIKGIGFKKADAIAKAVGYDMLSPHRINSAILYIIGEENQSGNSWIEKRSLMNRAVELLSIDKSHISNQLDGNIKGVMQVDERFTRKIVYEAENYVAMQMSRIKSQSKQLFKTEEIDAFLDDYCEKHGVELEENQRKFFYDWNDNNVLMLIGSGGMGKTWLLQILLKLIAKKSLNVALLAPTGKASKVISGYTGMQALTIHRKVGIWEEDVDGSKLIEEDIIIVDESSMCDVFVLSKLFKAIANPNARILFIGDDFQLPSVGVGNFLFDVINSNNITVSKLKKVFRQAEGGILNVATDIREGKSFLNNTDTGRKVFGKDCVFWLVESQYIRDGVISNYKKVIERFDQDDVVILTPTNKGKLGTIELNKEIQKIANPQSANKKEKAFGAKDFQTIFRVGDSVMNTVNTYDIETVDGGVAEIFNGDTGKIIDIDEQEKVFIIEIDGIKVKMNFNNILTNLVHSWVTTIHKSQGSQYKVVILIADKSMKYQLNANLLYTGGSRAKEYELWLTQAETINYSIRKFANMERRSFMQELLDNYNNPNSVQSLLEVSSDIED